MSLVVHMIAAGSMAYSSDGKRTNSEFSHSPTRLLASIKLAEPRLFREPVSLSPRSFDKATEKPVAPQIDVPPPEEATEEIPYASPDSIEQMASVLAPPDLPLPADPDSPAGFMRIKVFVNEDGLADSVELLESNFAEDYASKLAGLFKLAKFNPGVSGGKAVKSWRIVEIDYSSS